MKNKFLKDTTPVSGNVCFDVIDDILHKFNNTVHRTINMKPIDLKIDSYAKYNEDSNEKKILNSKLVNVLRY